MRNKLPLINLNQNEFPDWSELDYYDIINLDSAQQYYHKKKSNKESIFIGGGTCEIIEKGKRFKLKYGDNYISQDVDLKIVSGSQKATIIIVGGNWGSLIGNSGVFRMTWSPNPRNIGDPTDYDRNTDFDNHFHDCDEYWIIFNGSADVVSEGNRYHVSNGDCLITKMGDHHDIVNIEDYFEGIYFETTLKGKKRLGHLWNHTHN